MKIASPIHLKLFDQVTIFVMSSSDDDSAFSQNIWSHHQPT